MRIGSPNSTASSRYTSKNSGRGSNVAWQKIFCNDFFPAGGIGEERGGFHFFLRDRQLIIPFPIKTTPINVPIERQIEPRPMEMAPYNGNHSTQLL